MCRKVLIVGRTPPRPGSWAALVLEAVVATGGEVSWQISSAGPWQAALPPTPRGPQPRGKKGKPRHW